MTGRRITYIALLVVAVVLHLAYGQYATHYMVIFLLCIPVLSLLLSLPAAISARTKLYGGDVVRRGRKSRVRMTAGCGRFFPPEIWNVTVEAQNLFTGSTVTRRNIRLDDEDNRTMVFSPDTSQIGVVRFRIKRAYITDRLGLIPIPVKKGGTASTLVLPDTEMPVPEPALIDRSVGILKPKLGGFSEEHELRPYREGDPLNLIHWKLSGKFDEYIIREPQEVTRKEILLVADLPPLYEDHRSVLEQLCYLNDQLISQQIPYTLQYGRESLYIDSVNAFGEFMGRILSAPMRVEKAAMPDVGSNTLVYRIKPGKGERK